MKENNENISKAKVENPIVTTNTTKTTKTTRTSKGRKVANKSNTSKAVVVEEVVDSTPIIEVVDNSKVKGVESITEVIDNGSMNKTQVLEVGTITEVVDNSAKNGDKLLEDGISQFLSITGL
jgi:hypothetical protein